MFVRDRAQGERIALATLLPAIPLFLVGCIITLDLPEGTPENHEGETPALPSTTLPDGETPAPVDMPNQPSCYTRGLLKPGNLPGDMLFFLGGPGGKDPGCVGP
jgi:hypothetical protein